MLNINNLRREYHSQNLDVSQLNSDPFLQFQYWFEEARRKGVREPNAMVLSTASKDAKPSSRTILLKEVDTRGFIFFTSYESRKAQELKENPYVSSLFFWSEAEKQIIIEGRVEKLEESLSDAYFAKRPRGSQIGAWASHQDQKLTSRDQLELAYHSLQQEYEGREIPKPPYWGGYRIVPDRFEFWQGRENRLHDRFEYQIKGQEWEIVRLSP